MIYDRQGPRDPLRKFEALLKPLAREPPRGSGKRSARLARVECRAPRCVSKTSRETASRPRAALEPPKEHFSAKESRRSSDPFSRDCDGEKDPGCATFPPRPAELRRCPAPLAKGLHRVRQTAPYLPRGVTLCPRCFWLFSEFLFWLSKRRWRHERPGLCVSRTPTLPIPSNLANECGSVSVHTPVRLHGRPSPHLIVGGGSAVRPRQHAPPTSRTLLAFASTRHRRPALAFKDHVGSSRPGSSTPPCREERRRVVWARGMLTAREFDLSSLALLR